MLPIFKLFAFLILSCIVYLYFLDINIPPIPQVAFPNFDGLLCCKDVCVCCLFHVVPLAYFQLPVLCFSYQIQKIIVKTEVKEVTDYIFFQFYGVTSYIKVFNSFSVDFCVGCKIIIQIHSFPVAVFSTAFIADSILSPLSIFDSCVKYQLITYVKDYLWTLNSVLLVTFYASAILF